MNNGYTSIEINGIKIGLKFGMPCNLKFLQKCYDNPDMIIGDEISDTGGAYLLYCGYQNNCLVKEVEPEYKFEFFADFIEDAMFDPAKKQAVQEVTTYYTESRVTKKLLESFLSNKDEVIEEVKKKMELMTPGNELNHSVTENLASVPESMPI